MIEARAMDILRTLGKTFAIPKWIASTEDPFRMLVVTMISQNTTDRNTVRAFENLSNRFKITPEVLANAQTHQIEQCLKVAGLHRSKAKTIKSVSKIILDQFHGDLKPILSLTLGEARKELMQFPGVGPKTADVVLLFSARKPTIPVDTHVYRVSKRLGLVAENSSHETVRTALQTLYDPKYYLPVHVLLILQGRRYCRARNPLCKECPINRFCPSKHLWDGIG